MKSFFYFLLGVSVTLNTTLVVDYIKKANAYNRTLKQLEKKIAVAEEAADLKARVNALEKKVDKDV